MSISLIPRHTPANCYHSDTHNINTSRGYSHYHQPRIKAKIWRIFSNKLFKGPRNHEPREVRFSRLLPGSFFAFLGPSSFVYSLSSLELSVFIFLAQISPLPSLSLSLSALWEGQTESKIQGLVRPTGCPKKMSPCLRGHYSPKNGTTNKSRLIFEILTPSSFWWALKFFIFDHWGLRKWGLKRVTPYLKTWPN